MELGTRSYSLSDRADGEKAGDTWYYFRDENGDLFYQTAKGMRFAERMKAATKKLQEKKR